MSRLPLGYPGDRPYYPGAFRDEFKAKMQALPIALILLCWVGWLVHA